jgi:hypothetical protein
MERMVCQRGKLGAVQRDGSSHRHHMKKHLSRKEMAWIKRESYPLLKKKKWRGPLIVHT